MTWILKMRNDVRFNTSQHAYFKKVLKSEIYSRSLDYMSWQDQQAYISGRYLLTRGLKKAKLSEEIISKLRYSNFGKPHLPVDIDFSISHSEALVVCAISEESCVGLDVEKIREIEITDFESFFSQNELENILQSRNPYETFFEKWTIKEAVMKADGRGLSLDPSSIILSNSTAKVGGKAWQVKKIDIQVGYIMHLAFDSLITDSNIEISEIMAPFI